MADFCLQCNLDMFFGPYSDFDHFGKSGELTADDVAKGLGMIVLCEGCGPVIVDHLGRCISEDCLCGGHRAPGQREALRRAERWLEARSGRLGPLLRLRDRLLGTPWEPGFIHGLRWRWHDFLDRRRGGGIVLWEFDIGVLGQTADGTVHRSGDNPDAPGGGTPVGDLREGPAPQQMGEGPSS